MAEQADRADAAACRVEVRQTAQIGVDQVVAVDHEERGVTEDTLRCLQPACRAPQRVLKEVVEAQAGEAAAEVIGDRLWPVEQINSGFRDALARQPEQGTFEQRHADDGDHRLGQDQRQRPEPRPLTGGQNHGFHC